MTTAFGKGAYEIRRIEMVGPKVGKDLTRKAILAIIFSWIGILIYVGVRFEFRYALGGIIALVHDVLITITFLSLFDKEFDLNIVAALLTIIGYSINDTIVIFDRIRENARKNIKMSLIDVINVSVNQTLSRTILTSLTVFMVLLVLFFFGGAVIHDFTFALLVGTVAGVYSTVFIASPIVLLFEKIKPIGAEEEKITLIPLEIGGLTLFILVLLFGTFSILFGLPGNRHHPDRCGPLCGRYGIREDRLQDPHHPADPVDSRGGRGFCRRDGGRREIRRLPKGIVGLLDRRADRRPAPDPVSSGTWRCRRDLHRRICRHADR